MDGMARAIHGRISLTDIRLFFLLLRRSLSVHSSFTALFPNHT
jgi:hypothetical protein